MYKQSHPVFEDALLMAEMEYWRQKDLHSSCLSDWDLAVRCWVSDSHDDPRILDRPDTGAGVTSNQPPTSSFHLPLHEKAHDSFLHQNKLWQLPFR